MSRTYPQFKLRMPPALRSRVEQVARVARRSINAELVHRLEQSFALEVSANEPQRIPSNPARRELRLLCVLVSSRTGVRSLPVHTLRPVPPRVSYQGQWFLEGGSCLYLRETHATAPAPEVLARYLRLGQSDALRADPRAVRTGGISA
jgi:hypothetical protein